MNMEWQPMESAPRARRVLLRIKGYVVGEVGHYESMVHVFNGVPKTIYEGWFDSHRIPLVDPFGWMELPPV